jgi:hypothetical protein
MTRAVRTVVVTLFTLVAAAIVGVLAILALQWLATHATARDSADLPERVAPAAHAPSPVAGEGISAASALADG